MGIIKRILKITLTVMLTITIVFLLTYLSIVLPFSPYYINWEEPVPIYDKNRPIYIVEEVLIREYLENKIIFMQYDNIPEQLINAFIAAEDNRFFKHRGFDIKGILRALTVNVKKRDIVQGGSTISQQLARNLFLNHEQTVQRKLLELVIAIELERRFTKEEILEMYLNQIYFGNGNYGIERAALKYFNTSTPNLTLEQGAMLAAIIKAPNLYNPIVNPQLAIEQQQIVLRQMTVMGFISEEVLTATD
ncbi:monofunctional biosynthetic peptidoglycan transglycosylase [Anaerobranca californiensis DSM 14826]|jgi:monofunctional biosynthetic peptidoglycan transglycosylase|uniref:Penicillin-binding protein 1A n=1 Tax=Anaerobranca californiensis DSM 14826 TaxID=1120989 RepID=A0A1M6LJL7_9FIRM|nr:biosynthetic peptidoglycan transglycosylase [Anaerobranca californiensis]SHJ71407.1 monofunctional biosynthetic peptidoglycan transglycosylase [Anaerobranca californiensis DSM 14826]